MKEKEVVMEIQVVLCLFRKTEGLNLTHLTTNYF